MLNPMVVALSLGLFACNKTESLADDVKKVYDAPFHALASGKKDCKSQVETAERLFEMERTDHDRVRTAIARVKDEGAFQGAVLERVKALHDSPLAKSFAAACPAEARAIGRIARKTAEAIGLEEVIPQWPEEGASILLSLPRSCVLPSGVCFEFRGVDYGGERAERRCDAMSGRMVEQACTPNPRASRCQIEMGTELEHEIFDPEPRSDVAKARCEKPIEGRVYGKWIAAIEAPSPALPSSRPASAAVGATENIAPAKPPSRPAAAAGATENIAPAQPRTATVAPGAAGQTGPRPHPRGLAEDAF